jgi:Uma2 family endonuclease
MPNGLASPLPQKMTVDEFLAWTADKPGRFELYAGHVYAMAPERAGHAKVKFAVQTELKRAIAAAHLPCHMLPDGMTVRVAEDTAHEPDALVYCGSEVPASQVEIANPIIVVEVLSPSTRHIDASAKLAGYFKLPSVQHYLIVDPDGPPALHHQRQLDGTILTRIIHSGSLKLDPPGVVVDTGAFFG